MQSQNLHLDEKSQQGGGFKASNSYYSACWQPSTQQPVSLAWQAAHNRLLAVTVKGLVADTEEGWETGRTLSVSTLSWPLMVPRPQK